MTRLSHQDLRRNFRQLLASDTCYHTASVFDPMSARIAADLGFELSVEQKDHILQRNVFAPNDGQGHLTGDVAVRAIMADLELQQDFIRLAFDR